MNLVNWRLLSQPLNWLIVFLMLLFAAYFATLISEWLAARGNNGA